MTASLRRTGGLIGVAAFSMVPAIVAALIAVPRALAIGRCDWDEDDWKPIALASLLVVPSAVVAVGALLWRRPDLAPQATNSRLSLQRFGLVLVAVLAILIVGACWLGWVGRFNACGMS